MLLQTLARGYEGLRGATRGYEGRLAWRRRTSRSAVYESGERFAISGF
jgi:hypothetical protein